MTLALNLSEAIMHVVEYDEESLDPPNIGPEDFFVRTTLLSRRKMLRVSVLDYISSRRSSSLMDIF